MGIANTINYFEEKVFVSLKRYFYTAKLSIANKRFILYFRCTEVLQQPAAGWCRKSGGKLRILNESNDNKGKEMVVGIKSAAAEGYSNHSPANIKKIKTNG